MGENSGIQWTTHSFTHHTFSPWIGCQRVSPGCEHCYAEASNWRKPLAWDKAAAKAGERHRVFCSSLADVFEDRFELEPWRLQLFDLIRQTPNLDWLLLTKRPESIQALLREARRSFSTATPLHTWLTSWLDHGQPPANVWLGATVEDQQRADERIPALLKVPAAVRFLSCEPLLERVDLSKWIGFDRPHSEGADDQSQERGEVGQPPEQRPALDLVIIGGESGPGARPFHLDWARDLVDQCRHAGAAPFVKQLGSLPVANENDDRRAIFKIRDSAGGDPNEWPEDLRVREFPR